MALLVVGCGAPAPMAVPGAAIPTERPPTPTPSTVTEPTVTADEPSTSRRTEEPVTCDGAGSAGVAFSLVDAALGHRHLTVVVRNCSTTPLDLPAEPALAWIDEEGSVFQSSRGFDEPVGGLQLEPGAEKFLTLHWLSNGACERGPRELRVRLFGRSHSLRDCFQFGGGLQPDRTGPDVDVRWVDPAPHG